MFLALREIKHAKTRFFLISTILILISWLVFILSGLGNGLANLSAATFKRIDAHYAVFEDGARHSTLRSVISENMIDDLERFENVEAAAPLGTHTAVVLKEGTSGDDAKIDVSLLGINPGTFMEPKVTEGKQLDANNDEGVLVNAVLKDNGIELGDYLEVEGSDEKFKVIGFVENESFNHLPAIFTTMDMWRTIHFAAPGSDRGVEKPVNAIMLRGENIEPETIDQAIDGIETVTKKDAINGIPGFTAENGTIMMMLSFLFVISAFVIAVFFYVLTLQKTNQFGVMKAIGASNGFLGKSIIAQVSIISFISIAIGVALTYATAAVFPEGMPFSLDEKLIITYSIVLFSVSVLSSLISVRKVTKIDPLQAIGRVE